MFEEFSWKRFFLKILKRIGYATGLLTVVIGVGGLIFHQSCKTAPAIFKPINAVVNNDASKDIEKYKRTEETSYLTFPEWYLVFNPQEYAAWLQAGKKPSEFPYFQSINQVWSSYCTVYGVANTHYPANPLNHLMVGVIGVSFTVEYTVKGIWENTIGRLSEWSANGELVAEDFVATAAATEYGQFVPFKPFYEFPFGKVVTKLWRDTPYGGPHQIRKWERKIALTLEYGVKAGYSKLILVGTRSVYGIADTEVFATVENVKPAMVKTEGVRSVKDLGAGVHILALPHYQGFTDTVPGLVRQGLKFRDIAGNDEILLSSIVSKDFTYELPAGAVLFEQDILTDSNKKRVAVQAPVLSLSEIILGLEKAGGTIEHLFDY